MGRPSLPQTSPGRSPPDRISSRDRSSPPDRIGIARLGLMGMSLGFVLSAQPEARMPWVPAGILFLLALLVPRFKVLGWWLTVVFATFVTAISTGIGLNFLRAMLTGQSASWLLRVVILTAVVSLSGVIALFGLFSRGTRAGVERRTNAAMPGTF